MPDGLFGGNAYNTLDRQEMACGFRSFAPSLHSAGQWADGTATDLVMAGDDPERPHILSSAQSGPLGPLMSSLGIRQLLIDLSIALRSTRLVLAYSDDTFILSIDDSALAEVETFFSDRSGYTWPMARVSRSRTSKRIVSSYSEAV